MTKNKYLAIIFFILNFLDATITLIAVQNGFGEETNPLMKLFISELSPAAFFYLKILIGSLISYYISLIDNISVEFFRILIYLNILYILIFINNVFSVLFTIQL